MALKRFREIQLRTLWVLRPSDGGVSPWHSNRTVAGVLGRSEGAIRHRLMRYARKGWLLRQRGPDGWRYRLLPRGQARLTWLQEQAARSESFFKPLID